MENQVLYDWVSLTSKIDEPQTLIAMLGLDREGVSWEQIKGQHGYRDRLYWERINIHYNGREDMGVWLEMTGQGCRAFESFGSGDYEALLAYAAENPDDVHLTRLDVAFDDHTGVLDLDMVARDTLHREYISKAHIAQIEHKIDDRLEHWAGLSVYHGSRASNVMLRIYDKAAERGFLDRHWVRVELQLRDERAFAFVMRNESIGESFVGVLRNYLRYIDEPEAGADCNRSRWPMKPYWSRLLGTVAPVQLYTKPGTEYNMLNLENFVFRQAGGAIWTYLETHTIEQFLAELKEQRPANLNPKYKAIIEQAKGGSA